MIEQPKDKRVFVLSVLLVIALIVIIILLLRSCGDSREDVPAVIGGGEPIPGEQDKIKVDDVIHLPSYSSLTFREGTVYQTEVLANPGENSCLVRISLILADGTVIYRGEPVKPGYYTKPITLIAPMERGLYRDVTLKYECFTDDEAQTPLNGATCKVDITVR